MDGRRCTSQHDFQVTEVNKALLSFAKLVSTGHRAVFDPVFNYVEHCEPGEWFPLEENNGTSQDDYLTQIPQGHLVFRVEKL